MDRAGEPLPDLPGSWISMSITTWRPVAKLRSISLRSAVAFAVVGRRLDEGASSLESLELFPGEKW
jgi:hypothetical protein